MAADGEYTYRLNGAYDATKALASGVHGTETFTYTVQDSHGATSQTTLTFDIVGSNDAAVITGTAAGSATEDGGLTTGGTLTVADVDTGEAHFQAPASASLAGTYGTFTFNETSGEWGYALNNAAANVQALTGGQTVYDTLTVKSADGTASQEIKVTVTGTNDEAVITGTATGSATEDGGLTTGGTLTVADVDTGEAHFQAPASASLAGTYGTFTFNETSGEWGYTLNNAAANVQALAGGHTVYDTLTVKSADGTPQEIKVTIAGTNDAPVIAGSIGNVVSSASGNGSLETAQNLDGLFAVTPNGNVTDSGTVPHVTVNVTGEGQYEWFKVTVTEPGSRLVADVDAPDLWLRQLCPPL